MLVGQAGDHGWQQERSAAAEGAHSDPAVNGASAGLVAKAVDERQRLSCAAQDSSAGGRERCIATAAVDELCPHCVLELGERS